jgi:hypothetical protein
MAEVKNQLTYSPSKEDQAEIKLVLDDLILGRNVINKTYNYFNGRSLYETIDDWTKRWNGYIPARSDLLEDWQSRIFLNYTRNQIISYLVKTALSMPKPKITAVDKSTGLSNKKLAQILTDLNQFSSNEEQGDSRFFESAMENTIKGTVIKYEGYIKQEQEFDVPVSFDAETGTIKTNKEKRIVNDNCYQEIVPVEDFYISNPYQPDVQKQPFVQWLKITTYEEAETEFKKYPNWKYVKAGTYSFGIEPRPFYRQSIPHDLTQNQVQIVRYYNKSKGKYILLVNGVLLYSGVIPFKDGNYPFAKGVFEPFGNDFFWGAGFPQKIQGDQDLINTIWNMMVDKTYGSLLPFGLTSDVDDIIEDTRMEAHKIRKVTDIDKWKWETLPGVTGGEMNMINMALKFVQDNSGNVQGAGQAQTQRGGKLAVRQVLLQQQETMAKLGFSMNFLEDFERDRTELRVSHILQFYSIPKIEKITGKGGKEVENLLYREVRLPDTKLEDGRMGTRVIQLTGGLNEEEIEAKKEELSVLEEMGELEETPTEALAIDINTFNDFNWTIQIIKNSSYEKNAVLDQASRMEYANWRMTIAQFVPVDMERLIDWVNESYDIDTDQFKPQGGQQGMMGQGMMPGMMPQGQGQVNPAQQLAPTGMGQLSELVEK